MMGMSRKNFGFVAALLLTGGLSLPAAAQDEHEAGAAEQVDSIFIGLLNFHHQLVEHGEPEFHDTAVKEEDSFPGGIDLSDDEDQLRTGPVARVAVWLVGAAGRGRSSYESERGRRDPLSAENVLAQEGKHRIRTQLVANCSDDGQVPSRFVG